MARYIVMLPITGYVTAEVDAESEAAAIDAALEEDFSSRDIEEWEVHRQTNQGNIAYGSCTQACAELIET